MIMFRSIALALGLIATSAFHSLALDPCGIDILMLRLGMTEQDVRARLTSQGISGALVRTEHHPCPRGGGPCVDAIVARTKDGWLTIRFGGAAAGGAETIGSITYRFDEHGPGEPAMIAASVINRFGPPVAAHPMVWCHHAPQGGSCREDRPRLVFQSGPGINSTLILTTADAPASLAR